MLPTGVKATSQARVFYLRSGSGEDLLQRRAEVKDPGLRCWRQSIYSETSNVSLTLAEIDWRSQIGILQYATVS